MSMYRRGMASLVLAATLLLGLSSIALADTFGGPAGNETSAFASFVQVVHGVEYDWNLSADRDTIARYSHVDASYFATVDITCHGGDQDGQPGNRFISFGGEASVPFIVTSKLGAAVAGARVTGTEDTFDTCTSTDVSVTKSFVLGFSLHATSRPTTFSDQQCIDFSDTGDAPMRLTETGIGRSAAGTALVNGRWFSVVDGSIGHLVWSSVADPSCAQ